MKTLTLRIEGGLNQWLVQEAKRLGRSKSEIVREALAQQRRAERPLSLHDQMKDVCGIIKGAPRDTSGNLRKHLKGFGQ